MNFLLVFLGGGLGSVARFGISKLVPYFFTGKFPLATLISNTLACLIVGLVVYLFSGKPAVSDNVKHLVIIGFCGGFSTFSAFGLETIKLLQDGLIGVAIANVLISLTIGFGVIYLLVR